jgi:hypothetical protein
MSCPAAFQPAPCALALFHDPLLHPLTANTPCALYSSVRLRIPRPPPRSQGCCHSRAREAPWQPYRSTTTRSSARTRMSSPSPSCRSCRRACLASFVRCSFRVCAPCPCRRVFVRALTLAMLSRLFRARVHRRHVQGARDSGRAHLHRIFDSVLAADFVSARLFDAHQVSVE